MLQSKEEIDALCEEIIAACIEVHRHLGPGLLERVYQEALAIEFTARTIAFRRECDVPASFKGVSLGIGYRYDFLVEETVALEVKSVQSLIPDHVAQTINYVTLDKKPTALLVNFNCMLLKDGIRRLFPRQPF